MCPLKISNFQSKIGVCSKCITSVQLESSVRGTRWTEDDTRGHNHLRRDRVTVIFSSPFLSSPHFSVTAFSITSLPTPSIFCCCSPFSSHSFQISLNTVLPSHSRSSSPPVSLHILGICSLCQFFISHSLHFRLILDTFLLSKLHSQLVLSSLIRSLHCHHSFIQLFLPALSFSCCFSVSAIVSNSWFWQTFELRVGDQPWLVMHDKRGPVSKII